MSESIAHHAKRIALKLRDQSLTTPMIGVFIATSRHNEKHKKYFGYQVCALLSSTCDSAVIISHALKTLKQIYKEGFIYKKSGVMALKTMPLNRTPATLFEDRTHTEKRLKLMKALDKINILNGSETLKFAAEGISKNWRMRSSHKSPRYLSSWKELPLVN